MNFGWIVSVLLKGMYVIRSTVLRDIAILTEFINIYNISMIRKQYPFSNPVKIQLYPIIDQKGTSCVSSFVLLCRR